MDRLHHQFTVGRCAARQALKEILWEYCVHIQQPLRKGYRAKLMGETHYAKERMKELGYKAMALGLMF